MKSMEEMIAAAQKAAEQIQTQMNDAQAKLDTIEVEGAAGGGLVAVAGAADLDTHRADERALLAITV